MNTLRRIATAAALCTALAAQAGVIVNIKGYGGDGAGATIYDYGTLQVGSSVGFFNPVLLDLAAGDYTLADAWGQAGALYDAWNFQTGAPGSWGSHYVVAAANADGSYTLLLDAGGPADPTCHNHFCAWDTEEQARDAFLGAAPYTLHLAADTRVAFVAADYDLSDNAGGISISVDRVGATAGNGVPEPGSLALALAAGAGLAGAMRRRGDRA